MNPGFENTRVDLGEDLLETPIKTRASLPEQLQENLRERLDDELESARILLNEGMPEEAKKILYRILSVDPFHLKARERLTEIHDLELKEIFVETNEADLSEENHESTPDSEELIRKLEAELDMNLSAIDVQSSLFQDAAALEEYGRNVDRQIQGASAKDRIDLGIAFHELGLYALAIRFFKSALQRESDCKSEVSVLIARSWISFGNFFEAVLELEPILSDAESDPSEKLEAMYWMGRACEGTENKGGAKNWYLRIRDIEPGYRDVTNRLRYLKC